MQLGRLVNWVNSKEIVSKLTLEEKASLCSGADFWKLETVDRLGLTSIMMSDGPHGLRKQSGTSDHLGINESVPTTCFPTASATANSFDRTLLNEMGEALAEECLEEDVSVILGPGANIKRSPLCGRNFEYVSEDPYLTGEMAAALINGVQSGGIGVSLKHFAANNQEKCRLISNSIVDERALREIYLPGFEIAVKKSQPWTIMCSYNMVNGTYACENKRLLTEILRDEWGFEGLVVTDWGAMTDRVEAVKAGLDLEMPASGGYNDNLIIKAVQEGRLNESDLDKVVTRIVDLIIKAQDARKPGFTYNREAHHLLARKVAAQSIVLLKNEDNILPASKESTAAIIGAFAKQPRYQGAGSSKINPSRMECAYDVLALEMAADYAEGYSLEPGSGPDEEKIAEACQIAKDKDVVFIFAGLPDEYESEGFDRSALAMPESHNRLIESVAQINSNVVVVLLMGAPVLLPWAGKVKGILLAYLGGQAGGGGCADILLGRVNPSGKLAESYPKALEDNPSHHYFPGTGKQVEYRESIFVGYRYYDTAGVEVAYPFGYGLSYTTFEYGDLKLSADTYVPGGTVEASCTITNTGAVAGAEVVQLYVGMKNSTIPRALKELKAFDKVYLEPGESKTINFILDTRSFAYYNVPAKGWCVESGNYEIAVGASSQDLRLKAEIIVKGDGKESLLKDLLDKAPVYYELPKDMVVDDDQFEAVYGSPLPHQRPDRPYRLNSTMGDIKDTFIGKQMAKRMGGMSGQILGEGELTPDLQRLVDAMAMETPLRAISIMSSGAMPMGMAEGIVDMANGHYIRGFRKMNKATKKDK